MKIKLNKTIIENFKGPYVIAELSGNHGGSLKKAKLLVMKAKQSGAHAIKLQTFLPDSITLNSRKIYFKIKNKKSLWNNRYLYDLYQEAHTPWEWHKEIFDLADQLNLDYFSSVFDEKSVDFLEKLKVKFYKVSSFENNHFPLIEKLITINKPIIISLGSSKLSEIDNLIKFFLKKNFSKFILLKCVSSYPAEDKEMLLNSISFLQKRYNCLVGLSDHTLDDLTPIIASVLGACIIEKHIKLDNDNSSIDSKFAMPISKFESMCSRLSKVNTIIGKKNFLITAEEKKNRKFKRSIFISKDVKKNEIISIDNIKVVRPSNGLAPIHFNKVIGKSFKKNFKFGMPLKFSMIKK